MRGREADRDIQRRRVKKGACVSERERDRARERQIEIKRM